MILECKHCEKTVEVEVVHHYDQFSVNEPPCRWTFSKCPECKFPLLAVQEDYGTGWDNPYRIYPPQDKSLSQSIPAAIRGCFEEARTCYKAKAFTASALMCRKTLEGLCAHHGIKTRSLSSSLKELYEKGLIEKQMFGWAEELRLFGNEAAHDVDVTISAQDCKDIIEFSDALLEYSFTYRDRFESFKKRRAEGKNRGV